MDEFDPHSDDFLLEEVGSHIEEHLEDDVIKPALQSGMDLREYSRQVESELAKLERESINDYVAQSQKVAKLYREIQCCDSILERMEAILCNFHTDLGSISSDIQDLQNKSLTMHQRLQNRQAVRGELSQFVAEMVVPEQMIDVILNTAVSERDFIEQLHELDHKMKYVRELSFHEARACHDVGDLLEKLKIKAVGKIREFLLEKIYSFRKPLTNYQVPQNMMLKFRFYNEFLLGHSRTIAREVKDAYVDTTSKVYYSYFKAYSDKLTKLQFETQGEKQNLLGVEESKRSSLFATKQTLKNKSSVFSLGNRLEHVTTELEAAVILPHVATKANTKYPLEALFRSLNYALVDNASREYLFLCDFFMLSVGSVPAQELFLQVMGKSLQVAEKQLESTVAECFDSLALLLCIKIVQRFREIMLQRHAPVLENYWQTQLQHLWPRWELVMGLNIQSVRQYDVSAETLHTDTRPHMLVRRYAEFCAANHAICEAVAATSGTAEASTSSSVPHSDGGMERSVLEHLRELAVLVENVLQRLADTLPSKVKQLVFLINNYDLVIGVLAERSTEECYEVKRFRELMSNRVVEYVEEALTPYFGSVIQFVRQAEARQDNPEPLARTMEERVTQIIRGFNLEWRNSLERINSDIMASFTNFKNGTQIFQGVLSQFVQYYHRLKKVLALPTYKNVSIRNDLPDIHNVMVEIKKLKPAF